MGSGGMSVTRMESDVSEHISNNSVTWILSRQEGGWLWIHK